MLAAYHLVPLPFEYNSVPRFNPLGDIHIEHLCLPDHPRAIALWTSISRLHVFTPATTVVTGMLKLVDEAWPDLACFHAHTRAIAHRTVRGAPSSLCTMAPTLITGALAVE
eukprot:385281_1